MTRQTRVLSGVAFWVCLVANSAALVANTVLGSYTTAGLSAAVLVGLLALRRWQEFLEPSFDAQLGVLVAKRQMAELALQVFEVQVREGQVRIQVDAATVN